MPCMIPRSMNLLMLLPCFLYVDDGISEIRNACMNTQPTGSSKVAAPALSTIGMHAPYLEAFLGTKCRKILLKLEFKTFWTLQCRRLRTASACVPNKGGPFFLIGCILLIHLCDQTKFITFKLNKYGIGALLR